MSQHPPFGPNDGSGNQPGARPDFAGPAGPPPQGPEQGQQSEPRFESGPQFQQGPPQQPYGQGQQPYGQGQQPYGQQPGFQPQQPKPRWNRGLVTAGIIVVVVALLGTAWALFGRDLFPSGGETTPGEEVTTGEEDPGGEVPQGELPENPKIEAPAVIDEVAESAGLTCHDEATTGVQIKGCYLIDPGHLVNLRFRITDSGEIDRVNLTILNNETTPEQRSEELLALMDPLLPTLPISDADREAFVAAITGGETDINAETEWRDDLTGSFHYRFSTDTSSLNIGNSSADFMAAIPLSDDPAGVISGLTDLGWSCEEEGSVFDCEGPGRGTITGSVSSAGYDEPKLTGFMVWFDGHTPMPDEPRMLDAYTVLAASGEKGEALAVGLRMLAEGEKQFFNSDVEFYRGDSYYELSGVTFN